MLHSRPGPRQAVYREGPSLRGKHDLPGSKVSVGGRPIRPVEALVSDDGARARARPAVS